MAKELPKKWKNEAKSIKAIQVAFDVGDKIQYHIRKEALDMSVNPSDRVRQILGLQATKKPVRPRLSISLNDDDFIVLAKKYNLTAEDRLAIKKKAAEELVNYVESNWLDKK